MNKNIINLLLRLKTQYEMLFQNFPYKNDAAEVRKHEEKYYLEDFSEKVIPLLVKQLIVYRTDKIDNYLPFIEEKHQHYVMEAVFNRKEEEEVNQREISKKVENDFSRGLLENNNQEKEAKELFINDFFDKYKETLLKLAKTNPNLYLKTVGSLRNPMLQYQLINIEGRITRNIRDYIASLCESDFESFVHRVFVYTLDSEIEEYYQKWIGKDKIHIKFAKHLFEEDQYESAKLLLKNGENQSIQKGPEDNSLNLTTKPVVKKKSVKKKISGFNNIKNLFSLKKKK